MATDVLSATSLSADERRLLLRFSELLQQRLGDGLHAIWLYGSRARGEPPAHEDSDVDVLVIADDMSWNGGLEQAHQALHQAARELDLDTLTIWFSVGVHDLAWLSGRREIKSFFIAEVDRDKIVIAGERL